MMHYRQVATELKQDALLDEYNPFHSAWLGFARGAWCQDIDVRDFIIRNFTPYEGDGCLPARSDVQETSRLWDKVKDLLKQERDNGGVLDADTSRSLGPAVARGRLYRPGASKPSSASRPTTPLKRGIMPTGGVKMVVAGLKAYGWEIDPETATVFTRYRKSHNQGVFDAYTPEIRAARKSGIVTGLPDAYGRGRIIGDYRRVALYGVDRLIEAKKAEKAELDSRILDEDTIRLREELSEQLRALAELKEMAALYGHRHFQAGDDRARKPSRRSISAISARSRNRTAPPCRSAGSRPSSTSISNATSRRAR